MASRNLIVAVIGAATAVGRELGPTLEERSFPVGELRLLGTGAAIGETVEVGGEEHVVAALEKSSLRGCDLIFVAPGEEVPAELLASARAAGAVVIDGSSVGASDALLVFPGINDEELEELESAKGKAFVLPSPSSAQLAAVLLPLETKAGVVRAEVVCLETAAGAGIPGMEELSMQTISLLNGREPEREVFPHRLSFNVIPQVGELGESGETSRERQIAAELARLLGKPAPALSITCVTVPVFYGATQIVTLATERPLDSASAREALGSGEELKVLDDAKEGVYPMPMLAVGDESVQVGRIRETPAGLSLISVADGMRWGTVVPMVRIAELLREQGLL